MKGAGALATTLALAAALALAAGAALLHGASRGDDVPVARVVRAPFVREVGAEGNLRAVHSTVLTVPSQGVDDSLVVAWVAPDGAPVRAGEPVARFDPRSFKTSLRTSQDALLTQRWKASKERAESAADLAKLRGDGEVAGLELDAARRFQKTDETIFSRAERIESEVDGELARERADHAAAAERARRAVSQAERQLIAIQSRQAEAGIQRAERGLSLLTVKAPHDGVLLLRRDFRREPVKVGDTVWPGMPIAELPDASRFEAEVYVLEADAGGLGVGKPATVSLDALPGSSYPARIARVDTLAKPRFRGSPVQYFAVTLALGTSDPAAMKPGSRVTARLTLDRLDAALAVPREAVFERDGRTVVYRRRGRGFEPAPVVLGPTSRGRVVVQSGLAPGDVVALADPSRPAGGAPAGEAPAAGSPEARPAAAARRGP